MKETLFHIRDTIRIIHFCARFLRMPSLCQMRADTNLAIEKFYFSILLVKRTPWSHFRPVFHRQHNFSEVIADNRSAGLSKK